MAIFLASVSVASSSLKWAMFAEKMKADMAPSHRLSQISACAFTTAKANQVSTGHGGRKVIVTNFGKRSRAAT